MFSGLANAAMISGAIYDLALQKESNVIVEIDSIPKQLLVSKIGDYAFTIKPGNYTLYAHTALAKATESIIIDDDNNYTLDLILEDTSPSVSEGLILQESDLNVSSSNISDTNKSKDILLLVGLILIVVLALIILYILVYEKKIKSKSSRYDIHHKQDTNHDAIRESTKHDIANETKNPVAKSESQLDEYAHNALQLIKKEKRTTQKDLRKEIPLSEAKISLIVTELEDKGKIRKIKKGRGNILIFVKD